MNRFEDVGRELERLGKAEDVKRLAESEDGKRLSRMVDAEKTRQKAGTARRCRIC